MPTPCPAYSAPISMNMIRDTVGISSWSLRALSAAVGFSTPDSMSEFYCYSTTTTTTAAPCYTYPEIGRSTTANQACINQNNGVYVLVAGNADGLLGATLLYRFCSGTKPLATAGWYADGARARYWTGSAFSGSPVQCII